MECRHLDGNPSNNNLENLCWGTVEENMADRDRHGTTAIGIKHGRAKLTESNVIDIRDLYRREIYNQVELSRMFGIGQARVSRIIRGQLWKHLPV